MKQVKAPRMSSCQLEKDFDLGERKEAEINTNLAAIVSKLLKEKTEEH